MRSELIGIDHHIRVTLLYYSVSNSIITIIFFDIFLENSIISILSKYTLYFDNN